MADFDRLCKVVHSIASSFEESCIGCLDDHHREIANLVREQLYSGLDGNTNSLRPSYSDDPWFNETETRWRNDPDGYIEFKEKITPPIESRVLHLPARPRDIPNLFITGAFHESIFVSAHDGSVFVDTIGFIDGPDIVKKYGEDILKPGEDARNHIVLQFLQPWYASYLKEKGWK